MNQFAGLPLRTKRLPALCPKIFMVQTYVSRSKIPINFQYPKNLNNRTISSPHIFTYDSKNNDGNHSITIFHQYIHVLKGKIDGFMLSVVAEMPQMILLYEHHLKCEETEVAHNPNYELGAKYCTSSLKCGGVCIYIHKNNKCTNISLLKYSKEQDLEIIAFKFKVAFKIVIVRCVYRAPVGKLEYFLNQLDIILKSLESQKRTHIMWGFEYK